MFLKVFSDRIYKIDKVSQAGVLCVGTVGRAFTSVGILSMQASTETLLVSAVVFHTTLRGRPGAFSYARHEIWG